MGEMMGFMDNGKNALEMHKPVQPIEISVISNDRKQAASDQIYPSEIPDRIIHPGIASKIQLIQ